MGTSVREHQAKHSAVGFAILAAVALLGATGVGFRVLDKYLARPTDSLPLPPGTLGRIPLKVGAWVGQDAPMDDALRRATDTDDLVNRLYYRRRGKEVVGLYVAYGVKARDLMPHRPEVCYPGAGWTLDGSNDLDLPLPDGSPLACRVLRFSRGGFDLHQMAVVNYYIVDGQYCPDVSLLRSKAWRGSRGIRYMVQVQITCWTGGLRELAAAEASATALATESAEAIRSVLPVPPTGAGAGTTETASGRSGVTP